MALARCAHEAGTTTLSCGRCGIGICGKCAVNSMVGTRCRACAPTTERTGGAAEQTLLGLSVGVPGRAVAVLAAVGVAVAAAIYAWENGSGDQFTIRAIVYGGWVISLVLHEFSHSLVAYIGGDRGIKERGYLTLNPFKFMDPVFSVAIPLFITLIGGLPLIGGRTLVDHRALRGRGWEMAVSFAGPAMNLVIAGGIGLAFRFGVVDPFSAVGAGLAFLAVLQIAAAIFNLLPVPPLDGFHFWEPYLPEWALRIAHSIGTMGYFLVIGAFWFMPGMGDWFWEQVWEMAYRMDIPLWSAFWGSFEARLFDRGWWG